MNYTYETIKLEKGYGFHILCDGAIIITQEYKPDVDGFQVMAENEAEEQAKVILAKVV